MRSTSAFLTSHRRIHRLGRLLALLAASLPISARAAPLSIDDAIRAAWRNNQGMVASASMASAARADADSANSQRLPTFVVSAKALATNQPVAAFGLKLDTQRIGMSDFDPARLNSPDVVGAVGVGAALVQPLYMGDRVMGGARAAERMAQAEVKQHERRQQELAYRVAQAYFGALVAAEGVRYAEDVLAQAQGTESFSKARNKEGLVLDADVARATAFRAQAEADLESARERLASARAALTLLTGESSPDLSTALAGGESAVAAAPAEMHRPDLDSARMRAEAAREMVEVAKGSLKPEVLAQASVETLRSAIDQGATWLTIGVFARWKLAVSDWHAQRAAQSRASAASESRVWEEEQARHDVEQARRLLQASRSKLISAREAVAASESARNLRIERHRQGLLPLTEVLDAEAGLAGARALLLRSQFDARVAAAQLQLALGQPIEGVK